MLISGVFWDRRSSQVPTCPTATLATLGTEGGATDRHRYGNQKAGNQPLGMLPQMIRFSLPSGEARQAGRASVAGGGGLAAQRGGLCVSLPADLLIFRGFELSERESKS